MLSIQAMRGLLRLRAPDIVPCIILIQDKTQFIWLGTPHQLSKLQLQTITLGLGVSTSWSPLKQCASAYYLTVRWPSHPMSDASLARVFIICDRWILCVSHSRKTQPQPWYMRSLQVGWRFGAVGSDVGRINEVTLRRTRLVLGWVTVWVFNSSCGKFISV